MKTQKIVEDNENNRGQKYPLQEVTGFNQVVIKLQLIFNITICDLKVAGTNDPSSRAQLPKVRTVITWEAWADRVKKTVEYSILFLFLFFFIVKVSISQSE